MLSHSSVVIRASIVRCEARERLTQLYLDATDNSRRVSDSVEDIHSSEWVEATKKTRQACEKALAELKLHIREHKC